MSAGAVDLQGVLGAFLPRYLEGHRLHPRQRQICTHIRSCRTAALGGELEACERCEYRAPVRYRSCRDRHCPRCQGRASARWSERERESLLPGTYHHLVFTLPDGLNPWVQLYPRVLYAQLIESAWATLAAFGRDPRRLGGQLGATAVLHTWGQTLTQHVHCLVPGGALTEQGTWRAARSTYLFPVRALSRRFRGHLVSGLRRRAEAGELERTEREAVDAMLDALMVTEWVVYAKPCPGHAERVVGYLARYTHRTALSDGRLLGIEGERVALRYTDRRDRDRDKVLWIEGTELIRRFLLHVLPKGLMRIRHYGFLANRCRAERVRQIRHALEHPEASCATPKPSRAGAPPAHPNLGAAPRRCPRCRRAVLRTRILPATPRRDGG